MMENMYVNVTTDGVIKDITNGKSDLNAIHIDVKYIVGKDYVTFVVKGEDLYVERYRGTLLLYSYKFIEAGDYMITPLFVDKYKSINSLTRELYSYLKKNLKGHYYLEEDVNLKDSYEVVFSSWVDRAFTYRYKIKVNPEKINTIDVMSIVYNLEAMESLDLFNVHNITKGQSFFIDDNCVKRLTDINELLENTK